MGLLSEEGGDATMKGECEAAVAELCGITPTSSLSDSLSTNETTGWDNNASMTEDEDSCVGANAAEESSGGFRGGSEVSMEPPFLAKSKIDRYTKATVVG